MNEQVSETSDKRRFPIILSVRIDWTIEKELELINLYERKNGSSTVVRDWITEKMRGYERNPHYIKFKNQMAKRETEGKNE